MSTNLNSRAASGREHLLLSGARATFRDIFTALVFCGILSACQINHPGADPQEKRVEEILGRMTLREKIDLLGGEEFKTRAIPRLGIPSIEMTDGGIGPNRNGKSTNYSATINLAAAFDKPLMRRIAENMGEETHIKGCDMLLAPMINIIRTPFGGRAFELFSEDPYLTSRMAVEFVKGVQSKGIIACTKVIAVNNQEWNRFDVDVQVSERALQEIYLPAIKAAVQEGDSWTIMAAYNSINGDYGCENKHLLNDLLKKEWGFTGAVVSDWGGARSTVKMARSGLDLEMPVALYYGDKLMKAVEDHQVEEEIVNDKVRRLLRVMVKSGMLDRGTRDYGKSDTPGRRALALEAARKSIVLLQNKDNFLPLDRNRVKQVAVIGPNGDVAQMTGGGSGFLEGNYGISPLEGITSLSKGRMKVAFERGIAPERNELPLVGPSSFQLPDGTPGIKGEYFNNRELQGEPALVRNETSLNFDWGYGNGNDQGKMGSPDSTRIRVNHWSARWTGKLLSPGEGNFEIGLAADNGVRLFLDGKLVLDSWVDSRPSKFKTVPFAFSAGRQYDLKVEFYENMGSASCRMGLAPVQETKRLEMAAKLARKSDVVVLCLGLNKEMEGESTDRETLSLPENQLELMKEVLKVNPRTVVVLNNATPILMNDWIHQVPAVIEAFYPGQEGGRALAEILFGEVSPSGKLPFTLMKRWEDHPAYGTYPGTKQVADYSEGIFVGYRHFDKQNIEPQFPFGFGLSYTSFAYSGLEIDKPEIEVKDTLNVRLKIHNSGKVGGDEIVQLYIHDKDARIEREVNALKGFERVSLEAGETREVSFRIYRSHLEYFDPKTGKWVLEPGRFEVLVGGSSRNLPLRQEFNVAQIKQ